MRWVVGFAPAGGNDIIARLMGQWLSERTGQQFIVENKPGAATNIATEIVVNATPDGYTILLVGVSAAINATLYDNLSFNFLRDIVPAAGIMAIPLFVATNPSVPARTLPEFIAYAKARPGKINMGSAGIGSAGHLAGELFNMMAGVNLVHVPYRGNGPALAALLGGEVEIVFPTPPSSIEFIRTGKLRGLATTGAVRSEALPDMPTVGRVRSRLRDQRVVRRGRAQRHAGRDRRQDLQGSRSGPGRCQDEGTVRRSRRRADAHAIGRVHKAHRRRNRQVGQGDPAGQPQAGVNYLFFFFLNSNSSIRLPDGSSRSLARPAPASLISPRIWPRRCSTAR